MVMVNKKDLFQMLEGPDSLNASLVQFGRFLYDSLRFLCDFSERTIPLQFILACMLLVYALTEKVVSQACW